MLVFVFVILCSNYVWPIVSADIPHSHISVLEKLIEKYLDKTSIPQNSILDFLIGEANYTTEDTAQDFGINILDHRSLKKIIDKEIEIRNKRFNESIKNTTSGRRYDYSLTIMLDPNEDHIFHKMLDLMKTSIYAARYRLRETKGYRKRYVDDHPYNIGIIVGNCYSLVVKSEFLYNQMTRYYFGTYFLWQLLIYERLLAALTDVEDLVRRAFVFQEKYEEMHIGEEEEPEDKDSPYGKDGLLKKPPTTKKKT